MLYNQSALTMKSYNYKLLTLLFVIVTASSTSNLQLPTNVEAKIIMLYPLSTSSIPTTQYSTSFTSNFTALPVFIYGINDYKLGNTMANQDFSSTLFLLSPYGFTLLIASANPTSVLKFSISYFAVGGESNFSSTYVSLSNLANISSGSGPRTYSSYQTYSFSSSAAALTLPFLTGFYVQSNIVYQLNITTNYISSVNYVINIQTTGDCAVLKVSFYVLFYYPTTLEANGYYVYGGPNLYGSSVLNIANYSETVSNYTQTVFVLALRGFYGFDAVAGLTFGWSLLNVTNDVGYILINKTNIQSIEYSFLQVGKIITSTNTTNTTNTTNSATNSTGVTTATGGGSSNYLGIIVGVVVGVVVVGIGVLIAIKIYSHNVVFNTIPKKDIFRQLPSLAM